MLNPSGFEMEVSKESTFMALGTSDKLTPIEGAQIGHMIGGVIGLIFANRYAAAGLLGFGLEHDLRSAALGSAGGERDGAGHRQPMPVLHRGVAHVAELRLPPGSLAVKTAVGIAGAGMRVVLALLAVEVGSAVFVAAAVLGAETLVRGPRLNQRSVHRKMLVRQPRLDLRRKIRELVRDVLGELNRSLGRLYASEGRPSISPEQLLSALLLQVFYGIRSERQLMEQLNYNLMYRRFVGLSPDDPVWDPTTFTKNRDRLQNGEVFAKFMTKLLDHQRIVRRKPSLGCDVGKQPTLIHKCAPHASLRRFVTKKLNHDAIAMARFFSGLLVKVCIPKAKPRATPKLAWGDTHGVAKLSGNLRHHGPARGSPRPSIQIPLHLRFAPESERIGVWREGQQETSLPTHASANLN